MNESPELKDSYTSTGEKLYYHQEAMQRLRNGYGTPISAWCAPTDLCDARCSFCSVQERAGDSLPFSVVKGFVDQLVAIGLKSIVFSGGGNFLLWRDKEEGLDCNDIINYVHGLGVECALITNGLPLIDYGGRMSWKTMRPETLDKLTWCRISMAGLDSNHSGVVNVPDFDKSITSLGFSWIMADAFEEPSHKHKWVSTPDDIKTPMENRKVVYAVDRLPQIEEKLREYVEKYEPSYLRLLCDCLRPDLIPERHEMLSAMANRIDGTRVFSQKKPPRQPDHPCAKVYTRPCLNADGWVYPCDSVVLNKTANHQFGSVWRVCRWDEVGELFSKPIRQVIPNDCCPGCVFADAVDLIGEIIGGKETPLPAGPPLQHVSYI
jgi:hypothetical protein